MIVVIDSKGKIVHFSSRGCYVELLSNGCTILTPNEKKANAYYCQDTDTYWPVVRTYAGQQIYLIREENRIPEGATIENSIYTENGVEIDEMLKKECEQKEQLKDLVWLMLYRFLINEKDESFLLEASELLSKWKPGRSYRKGSILSYISEGSEKTELYQVLEDHISEESKTPDTANSLFRKIQNGE